MIPLVHSLQWLGHPSTRAHLDANPSAKRSIYSDVELTHRLGPLEIDCDKCWTTGRVGDDNCDTCDACGGEGRAQCEACAEDDSLGDAVVADLRPSQIHNRLCLAHAIEASHGAGPDDLVPLRARP